MNLEEMKEKCRQILEESQEDNSEEQWEEAYQRANNQNKKRVLTQSSLNNLSQKIRKPSQLIKTTHKLEKCLLDLAKKDEEIEKLKEEKKRNQDNKCIDKYQTPCHILHTKQKLAQSIEDITNKERQIQSLKEEIIKLEEKNKFLQSSLQEQRQHSNSLEQELVSQKIMNSSFKKEKENLNKSIQQQKDHRDVILRKVSSYEEQIRELKETIQQRNKALQQISQALTYAQKYKRQNKRFKEDISRLKHLLSENAHFKKLVKSVEYSHFLGRSTKEYEYWFSRDLVDETENFLKKQKIQLTKESFNSLVKFISKKIDSTKKMPQKYSKKQSRSKQKSLKRYHTVTSQIDATSTLKHTSITPYKKKNNRSNRSTYISEDKKTQTFTYKKKKQQAEENSHSYQLCQEILTTFRKGIVGLMEQSETKMKKKLMKLVEWMTEGVLLLFACEDYKESKKMAMSIQPVKCFK